MSSSTNNLNGYTEVLAISQNTINSQLALLCPRNNAGPIFTQWSIMDPNDPNQWQGLVVTAMAPPTVSVLQPDGSFVAQEMAMTLNLTSGTLQYYNYGAQASIPIDHWTITFRVSLAQIQLTGTDSLTQISASTGVTEQLTGFLNSSYFTIAALYTYFESANIVMRPAGCSPPSARARRNASSRSYQNETIFGLFSRHVSWMRRHSFSGRRIGFGALAPVNANFTAPMP